MAQVQRVQLRSLLDHECRVEIPVAPHLPVLIELHLLEESGRESCQEGNGGQLRAVEPSIANGAIPRQKNQRTNGQGDHGEYEVIPQLIHHYRDLNQGGIATDKLRREQQPKQDQTTCIWFGSIPP